MGLHNWDKSALSTLAGYLCQTRYEDLTQEAIVAAKIRFLDYLGTAIHASRARPWLPVYDLYRSFHLEDGLPKSPLFEEATVIGGDVKLPCGWAAMADGGTGGGTVPSPLRLGIGGGATVGIAIVDFRP